MKGLEMRVSAEHRYHLQLQERGAGPRLKTGKMIEPFSPPKSPDVSGQLQTSASTLQSRHISTPLSAVYFS